MTNFFLLSIFLSFFWFIRETKAILFWLYLWQLKEYHIGRFLDHFQTEKGKRLLFNKLLILKILTLLIPVILWRSPLFYGAFSLSLFLIILYSFESIKGFYDFSQKKFKKPVFTKKVIFLVFSALVFEIFYLFSLFPRTTFLAFYLLTFDILTPAITSGIVLIFQPLTVFLRNQIIKKAKLKRENFRDLLVIGVTGSYGKTSTKEFLATILSKKFKVLKTKAHQNSEIGISQCILDDLKPEHEIFVVEMGAYNRGGIKLLCDIAKPKIGILTGINEQHLATFGSQENIIKTKYELIESLPQDGLAVFNGSDPYVFSLFQKTKKPKKVYRYRATADYVEPDIFAKGIIMKKEKLFFKTVTKDKKAHDFRVNLLGAQHVGNILAAILVAKVLGMPLEEIAKACQKIKAEQGTIQIKKGINGINILDSTYSANPDGVLADLDYLKIWRGPAGRPPASYGVNKKVIVMPCLIELGKATTEIHQKIGEKIGEVCDLCIITTKERFKEIKEGAINNGMAESNIFYLENPREIFERIKTFCKEGDIILLESRVPTQLISLLVK
ncbi:MAG: UDP-N-acetylmuramoyl-tripeptide--D-alanyl-D-alanine ligase [Candidatus Paceibacterales bacterium]